MLPDEGYAQLFRPASVGTVVLFGPPHSAGVVGMRELVAPAFRPAHMSVVDPAMKAIPVCFGNSDVTDRSGMIMQRIYAMFPGQGIKMYGIAGREVPEHNGRVKDHHIATLVSLRRTISSSIVSIVFRLQ